MYMEELMMLFVLAAVGLAIAGVMAAGLWGVLLFFMPAVVTESYIACGLMILLSGALVLSGDAEKPLKERIAEGVNIGCVVVGVLLILGTQVGSCSNGEYGNYGYQSYSRGR